MIQKIVLGLAFFFGISAAYADVQLAEQRNHPPYPHSYYDWGLANDGFGYCFQFTGHGQVLNGGRPVNSYLCEQERPSVYNWARANNGYGYCFHFTPYGHAMDQGRPANSYNCEQTSPSYYQWARANNGYTYCFQFANGLVLNEGRPVSNYFCGGR